MRIERVSKLVIIDEIPEAGELENYIYILSRPFQFSNISQNINAIIYTTPLLKNLMLTMDNNTPYENVHILRGDTQLNCIKLHDGNEIRLRVIDTDSLSGNVMILFEVNENHILYTGEFTKYRSVLMNPFVIEQIQNCSIEKIFIDTTLMSSSSFNSITKTCRSILSIVRKFKSYKIELYLDEFGSEDLIYALASCYKLKIYINPQRYGIFSKLNVAQYFNVTKDEADIVIISDIEEVSLKTIYKKCCKDKIVTMMLSNNEYKGLKHLTTPIYVKKDLFFGISIIHYSPHPTFFDLSTFIKFIAPKNVHSIFNTKIPKMIQNWCAKDQSNKYIVTEN